MTQDCKLMVKITNDIDMLYKYTDSAKPIGEEFKKEFDKKYDELLSNFDSLIAMQTSNVMRDRITKSKECFLEINDIVHPKS